MKTDTDAPLKEKKKQNTSAKFDELHLKLPNNTISSKKKKKEKKKNLLISERAVNKWL